MSRHIRHVLQDFLLLAVSIGLAVRIAQSGLAENLTGSLNGFLWLGIIIAGVFFTSFFTTPISIVMLGTFAKTTPLPILALLGGFGAMLGDYVIFRFVKDRVSEDLTYLFSHAKRKRFFAIFRTKLFRFFIPFIGALIIASPLPDEIGIAMLGMTKVKNRTFFILSFLLNSTGIFLVGLAARAVVGQ